jgi:hypothetical protein
MTLTHWTHSPLTFYKIWCYGWLWNANFNHPEMQQYLHSMMSRGVNNTCDVRLCTWDARRMAYALSKQHYLHSTIVRQNMWRAAVSVRWPRHDVLSTQQYLHATMLREELTAHVAAVWEDQATTFTITKMQQFLQTSMLRSRQQNRLLHAKPSPWQLPVQIIECGRSTYNLWRCVEIIATAIAWEDPPQQSS